MHRPSCENRQKSVHPKKSRNEAGVGQKEILLKRETKPSKIKKGTGLKRRKLLKLSPGTRHGNQASTAERRRDQFSKRKDGA